MKWETVALLPFTVREHEKYKSWMHAKSAALDSSGEANNSSVTMYGNQQHHMWALKNWFQVAWRAHLIESGLLTHRLVVRPKLWRDTKPLAGSRDCHEQREDVTERAQSGAHEIDSFSRDVLPPKKIKKFFFEVRARGITVRHARWIRNNISIRPRPIRPILSPSFIN